MTAMLGKNQSIIESIKVEIVKEDDTYCYSINTEKGHLYLAQNTDINKIKLLLVQSFIDLLHEVEE